jgi:transposase-like protein
LDAEAQADALREAIDDFSGQLAVDEVYDGEWAQLKATDPLNDREIDYEFLEGSVTQNDVVRFFRRLRNLGIDPQLVTTDGSSLYPAAIKEVWPNAEHQRCVFHFIQEWNERAYKVFSQEYGTMPTPKKRKRGRPKKRGRPRKDEEKRINRKKVWRRRYLLFKREDHLSDEEAVRLGEILLLCPGLLHLRRLVIAVHVLLSSEVSDTTEARRLRQSILNDPIFSEKEEFSALLEPLADDALFEKLLASLKYENAERTTNHVERRNREFRRRQRSHYKLRSLESLCALLDLVRRGPKEEHRRRSGTRLIKKPTSLPFEKEVSIAA